MLSELVIRNFAIIDEQSITFKPGLNVLSGETGAGKSIILSALEMILGGKPRAQFVRSGCDTAEVQALFSLEQLPQSARELLPDLAREDELVVTRTLSAAGRGKVYLNGRLATVGMLGEIVSRLVNVCGQNQHVRLLDTQYHRELLDGFAAHDRLLNDYRGAYREWRDLSAHLKDVEENLARNADRRAELETLVEELSAVGLRPGLRDELEGQISKLANAEQIIRGASAVTEAVEREGGPLEQLNALESELRALERLDPGLSVLSGAFFDAVAALEQFNTDLGRYVLGVELNEEQLENLRERLATLARLSRKHRCNESGLEDLFNQAQRELTMLEQAIDIDGLRERARAADGALQRKAGELSTSRRAAGKALVRSAQQELRELALIDARFAVNVESETPAADGADRVEFMISTNKGEPPRALRQVASGGELSRIMLVLKKVLRERSGVSVLVFDEVDSGVSGSVARAVGEKLRAIAEDSQVICITHLPQVASLANAHFLVEKNSSGARTVSRIRELTGEERVEEIARMLAGFKITAASRASARELLAGGS